MTEIYCRSSCFDSTFAFSCAYQSHQPDVAEPNNLHLAHSTSIISELFWLVTFQLDMNSVLGPS